MNDDLEHTVRDSLDRHAAGARTAGGNLDDVYQRADRRRARRRSVAVVGSIAAVTVGIVGFAALGNESDPALEQAAAPGDEMTTTTSWAAYACTGYLGSKDIDGSGPRDIYSDCVPIGWSPAPVPVDQCPAVPATVPMTTIPMTTITTTTTTTPPNGDTGISNATAQAVVCGATAPSYDPSCFPMSTTTTMPAIASTTTSVVAAIGTAPAPGNVTGQAVACETDANGTAPPGTGLPASGPPMTTTVSCITSTTTSSTIAPTETTPTETTPTEQQYIVVAGDDIGGIAQRYRIAPEIMANYNGWTDCLNHTLLVGDVVLIPPYAAIP